MSALPIVMSPTGRVNTPPATLRATLVALATAMAPGLTTELPASLIEDIVSTDVGALITQDQALTDLINSLTPYGANEFLLNQLGQIYGPQLGGTTNTSVYCVFSSTSIGFVVNPGFTVSDGTYQYVVQDGGAIGSGGSTPPLYCVATVSGTWSVTANTVTELVTIPPSSVSLTVTNPNPGTPGAAAQTEESYRSVVLTAGKAAAQGMATFLRSLLVQVSGVQPRLIGILQKSPGWEVIVGGGDPYAVGYAIYSALFDITILQGSSTTSRNVTVAIEDFPDTYTIVYVNPPAQSVGISVTWNTNSLNYVSPTAIADAAGPALVDYINALYVGQPMNLFVMETTFQEAVANILTPDLLTRMVFAVTIDGTPVSPTAGTGIIAGDPEGYFTTNIGLVTIAQG